MAITKSNRKSARKSQAQAAKTENDDTSDVENVEETTATSKLEKSFKKKDTKKSKDVKKKNKKQEDDEDSDNEDQDASINGAEKNKQKTSDTLKTDEVEGSDEEEESDDESEEEAKNAKANKTSKKNNSTGKEGESSEEDDYSSENGESEEDESNKGPGETRSSFKADRNSLIVGNLPYSATNNMLQELLQTVITKKEIKDCNIAAYNNGKTKGYAYVEVTSKEAVEKVLQLNGSKMDCRKLLVAVNDRRIDKIFAQVKNTLHIGYISKAATDGQIIEFLEKVIPINEIVRFERVKTFRGEPMGYLILEVASEEAAEQIKKLHEVVLDGQAITVNEYRTSVVNPNFLTTIHQNLNKGSHFKKNFSNNRRSGNRGSTDGYNKNTNQAKYFKKRAFSDRSDGTQKQQKSKKPRT